MTSVITNAGALARAYRARIQRWGQGLRRGLRDIGVTVENEASRNLSGSGAPGSYPVPIRTGHLRRSLGMKVGDREVVVYNSAKYANAIHQGFTPYGNKHATKSYAGRPFLQDAADKIDATAIMFARLREVLQ